MKIYAPVSDFNGWRNNIRFVNGVAETDDQHVIKWFETHGYTVEKCDNSTQNPYEKCDNSNFVIEPKNDEIEIPTDEIELMGYADKQPDFKSMTPNELRDWAKANGFGNKIKNTRNKEKLIEILRG